MIRTRQESDKQVRRPSPLMSFMGDLIGHTQLQNQQQEGLMLSFPSFSVVVDNAHIHPKHAWATSQVHHHVSRVASCPDINHNILARPMHRASSAGSLCRWGGSSSASSGLDGCDQSSGSGTKADGAMRKPQRKADDESLITTTSTEEEDDGFGDFGLFLEDDDDEDNTPAKGSSAPKTIGWNIPSTIKWEPVPLSPSRWM